MHGVVFHPVRALAAHPLWLTAAPGEYGRVFLVELLQFLLHHFRLKRNEDAFVGHRLSLSAAALFAKRYDGWAALVGIEASVLASDFIIVTNLVAQGLGIGVAPSVIAASHLASGALVPVLPALDFGTHLFVLTWPKALELSGRIRTFVELAAGVADNEDLD